MGIIIKPIITEKATAATEKAGRYGFIVDRSANKIEIKNAIEKHYKVKVTSVNTIVSGGGKQRTRYTVHGVSKSPNPIVKKAFVTLAEGDAIDLYSNI